MTTELAVLAPIAVELTKKALSVIFSEATNIRKTQENLNEAQLSQSDIRKKTPAELIEHIFDLRSYSFELFDGLDFFKEELDEALEILQKMIEHEESDSTLYREKLVAKKLVAKLTSE